MATIAETFSLALQHHRDGNLLLAEHLYRQILQADPGHADSHHLLGVVAYQADRHGQALASISQAIALSPGVAIYHTNLGLVHDALGKLEAAVADYREALRLAPDAADAHNNLANALQRLHKPVDAEAHCRLALQLRPEFPEAYNNLGNALLDQGKWTQAVESFQQALRLNPGYAEVYNNLGNAFERQRQFDEAMTCYRQSLQLQPNSAAAWYNLGSALERLDRLTEAISCYQQALRIQPQFAQAHNNLGIALKRQDKLDDALKSYQNALRVRPNYAEAHANLGNVQRDLGHFAEALACYEQALQHDAESAEAHFNRALVWLLQGNWTLGWPEYEWRWRTSAFPRLDYLQPRWDGSNLAGRTILLHAEQGLGDTLQFIRYVRLVKERGARVIVQCQAPLRRLLGGVPEIDVLVPQGSPLPTFDIQAPLLSLPAIFQTTLDSVPQGVPYVHPDKALVEHWRQELAPLGGVKIGIAWQGNAANPADRKRSVPLAHFAALAQVEGVRLISLQKGQGTEQLPGLAQKFPLLDLGNRLDEDSGPFMDTAAVMKNLDLVITSDTAVPHLAGALGIPVWVALPLVPDWRWLLEREDSPWYPTMRLFRQGRGGDWEGVFERIACELRQYAENMAADKRG